jgi:pyridoxamine 5'-phosphate oxidase family protein
MTTRADAGLAANPFTDAERSYLGEVHPMARLATVGADGTPHVTPLGMYEIEDATGAVVTRGKDLTATKKWRDVTRSGRAALVVDDVLPPFRPRGIEIRGRAEAVADPSPVIRLFPERIVAWGLDATTGVRHARDVDASREATRHSC